MFDKFGEDDLNVDFVGEVRLFHRFRDRKEHVKGHVQQVHHEFVWARI